MRIAYDYQVFNDQRYGGISRYFFEVASRLARTPGLQVGIVAPLHVNAYLAEARPPLELLGCRAPDWPRTGRLFRQLNHWLSGPALRRFGPDIVHETYYARQRTSAAGPRVVLTVLDMIHERFPESFSPRDITFGAKARAVERADRIICISENTKRDLLEIMSPDPAKVSVVHLGFSLTHRPAVAAAAGTSRPYLLYVGARGGYKNFSALLEAYAANAGLHGNYDLVAFGGGGFTATEHALIARLGLRATQVMQRSGGDDALADHYQRAALFIYPSLYEGFGIPPLEAMSFDCPVVTHNASSIPEVVGDAAELTDCSDPGKLCTAVERVLTDGSRRSELIALGRQRLKHFSWERCATETLAVYRGVLG